MKTKLETLTINELYAYYKLSIIVSEYYGEVVKSERTRLLRNRPNPEYDRVSALLRKFNNRKRALWSEIEKRLENLEIVKELEDLEC